MQLDLLALVAAIAAGAAYIIHPDETTKLAFTGAAAAFLALLRAAPVASVDEPDTSPGPADVYTDASAELTK